MGEGTRGEVDMGSNNQIQLSTIKSEMSVITGYKAQSSWKPVAEWTRVDDREQLVSLS